MVRAGDPAQCPQARISEEDILHAWRHAVDVWEQDDDMTMLIGPDCSARLLEVGLVDSDQGPVIVHCMLARRKYLGRRKYLRR